MDSRGRWITVSRRKKRFLVPVRALADRFRGVFLRLARQALPDVRLPYLPKKKRWVAYCKETIQGKERVLEYLGRYVHRTALSNNAIVTCTDDAVTFRYRNSRDNQEKTMTLPPQEFLRRFLQHVLPRGFHRVRSFGLLHASQRVTLRRLQLMLERPAAPSPEPEGATKGKLPPCPVCKIGSLRRLRRYSAADCLQFEFRQASTPTIARSPPR